MNTAEMYCIVTVTEDEFALIAVTSRYSCLVSPHSTTVAVRVRYVEALS